MTIIENLARASTKLLIKIHSDEINEALFLEGSVRGLLIEALEEEDKGELEAAIKGALDAITEFEKTLPKEADWSDVIGPIAEKFDSAQIDIMYDESADPKERADAAAGITKSFQDAAGEFAAMVSCIAAVQENLKAFKPEDESKTIGDLSSKADGKDFPTQDDLAKGIEKAYQIPEDFNKAWAAGSKEAEKETGGGIFKKIGNFIKSLFGGDKAGNLVPPGDMVKPIMASPYGAFMTMNVQGIQAKLGEVAKAIGTETAEASAGAAISQAGENTASVSGKEAKEEQALADDALKAAAEKAVTETETPAVAIANALDGWADGLSKTSRRSLSAKGRMDGLKDLINTALEDSAKTLEKEVAAAVGAWRDEHEEALMKSKRFAQKNFDSLEQIIPAIAGAMLKKTSEANYRLTRGMVQKSVFRYLDKKFNREDVLLESNRWEQLAGLRRI